MGSIYSHICNKINKISKMFSTKIPGEFINSRISCPSIDTPRPSRDPYRSSKCYRMFRVTMMLLSAHPYCFKLDIQQDAMHKRSLVNQARN